jgi:serine/threonine protein kinase
VVALKEFVLPVYPDARLRKQAAERFQVEAEMLSRLQHPQIVRFLDLFIEDHRAYLVLERAEGTTLKALVRSGGALPEKRVTALALQMCEILGYLHSRTPPVCHRDFTPDNLILGSDGLIRLVDFSVAQQIESRLTGSIVGKPAYMAPEQFRGKPTPASDIYSLGASLFYLLIGHDPEPISESHPRAENAAVTTAMDDIVARATRPDASQRYHDVQKVKQDLDQLASTSFT